jgi:hypothetical protein
MMAIPVVVRVTDVVNLFLGDNIVFVVEVDG